MTLMALGIPRELACLGPLPEDPAAGTWTSERAVLTVHTSSRWSNYMPLRQNLTEGKGRGATGGKVLWVNIHGGR